jgi:hypothetical protein
VKGQLTEKLLQQSINLFAFKATKKWRAGGQPTNRVVNRDLVQFRFLKKTPTCDGEPAGVRTRDLLIKSQLLYRLSYRLPKHGLRDVTRSVVERLDKHLPPCRQCLGCFRKCPQRQKSGVLALSAAIPLEINMQQ